MMIDQTIKSAPMRQPWPSKMDRPIAILPLSVHDLEARFGLQFEPGLDDLGPYHAAAIWLQPDQRAILFLYDDYEEPGPTAWIDACDDIAHAQALLLQLFGLEPSQMPWMADPTIQSLATSAHA